MKQVSIAGGIAFIIIIILVQTGAISIFADVITGVIKFSFWLFSVSMTEFGIGPLAEIIVKLFTFLISFSLVGLIFNTIGLFNKDAMKIVYLVLSTVIAFAFSYVIMLIQTHIVIISWIIFALFIILTGVFIILYYRKKRNKRGVDSN